MPTAKSQSLSLTLHFLAVAALLFVSSQAVLRQAPDRVLFRDVKLVFTPPSRLASNLQNLSGGANRSAAPARKGNPPPHVERVFIPPRTQPDPKLPMPIGIDYEIPAPLVASADVGDPLSKFAGASLGSGGVNGIGVSGCCRGVGDHKGGPGVDGSAGHLISHPVLIYKVEPEFSEEARKAKFQGTVVLMIEVDASGHPSHLEVVSSPGLGLDAKAIAAVAQWRFRPALRDGKPFATGARIEVHFQLL